MKLLALEYEMPSADPDVVAAYQLAEARRLLELVQADLLREVYYRAEKHETVLILECADADQAHEILQSLPLVQAEQAAFEVIPLAPYDGFAQLIEQQKDL